MEGRNSAGMWGQMTERNIMCPRRKSTKPSAYELRKKGVRGWIVSPQKLHSGPNPGTRKCDLCGNRVLADVEMRSLGWALIQ